MEPWVSSPNKSKPVIVTLADGINQSVESIEIKDSQALSAVNVDSFLYPTLQTVYGYTLHSKLNDYINRIFKFKGLLYCCTFRGVYKYNGTSWISVFEYGDSDITRLWDSAQFFDGSKLYFTDGSLPLQEYNGTTLITLPSAPISNFVTTYSNRFYVANKNDNLLSYSGLRDANDWSSTNKYTGTGKITVETQDGEKPTGLTNFANHVLLFKRYTMHKLFGEDSTNFNMTQPYGVGCIADRTIVPTRDSLFWLGPDGFYDYMGGAAPTRISDPIKKYIEQINMDYAHQCCAGTDGRFVYLSLVTGNNILPNVTLKFDLITRAWWPVDFVATAYYLDGQTMYFGTADGMILRMGGTSFAGSPINWNYETKPFSADETARSAIHRIFIVADIEVGSTLNVAYAGGTEGGAWTVIKTMTNGTGMIQSIKIPVVVRTPEFWFRLKLYGTGKVKIHRLIREVSRRGA